MSGNLTTKQALAIDALLSGQSAAGAAAVAGVNGRTLRRWRAMPHFHTELQARAGEALDDATRHLTAVMAGAPSVIDAVMTDEAAPPAVRIAAARIAIESGLKLIEIRDLLARIEALEKGVK